MSTVEAATLRDLAGATETPMKYPVQGSAKMMVNLNGTGTIAIRGSLNVSSANDGGVGIYGFNFTASMNSGYGVAGLKDSANPSGLVEIGTLLTGAVSVVSKNASNNTTVDASTLTVSAIGDLAP